jgi:gluconokinase
VTRVLALDVGTSSVRAIMFDERGRPVPGEEAQTAYEVTHGRDGRAELDADRIVDAARAVFERVHRTEPADAVAVSVFWHSLLVVDRQARPISPLLIWQDTRSAPQADELARRLDREAVHARTGAFLHPSFWPAKLAWLREQRPEIFRDAHRFLGFADYLQLRLRGVLGTSLSTASGTGLLDLARGSWDEALLGALGLDPARLPPISDEPVDGDEPWFPPLGDGACSNVGSGATCGSRAALMVGTSAAIRTIHEGEPAPRPGLFLYRLDAGRLVEGASFSDGGNLWSWLGKTLRLPESIGLADREPDGHGLTFLTLLGGERSPGWNGRARGAITGLTFDTTPADLLQAALEAAAARVADALELMPEVEQVVATGHALLANPDWLQVIADALERPLERSAVAEASARGAAVLALERLGIEAEPAPVEGVVEPRPERAEAYRGLRERLRLLYDAVT